MTFFNMSGAPNRPSFQV